MAPFIIPSEILIYVSAYNSKSCILSLWNEYFFQSAQVLQRVFHYFHGSFHRRQIFCLTVLLRILKI